MVLTQHRARAGTACSTKVRIKDHLASLGAYMSGATSCSEPHDGGVHTMYVAMMLNIASGGRCAGSIGPPSCAPMSDSWYAYPPLLSILLLIIIPSLQARGQRGCSHHGWLRRGGGSLRRDLGSGCGRLGALALDGAKSGEGGLLDRLRVGSVQPHCELFEARKGLFLRIASRAFNTS